MRVCNFGDDSDHVIDASIAKTDAAGNSGVNSASLVYSIAAIATPTPEPAVIERINRDA